MSTYNERRDAALNELDDASMALRAEPDPNEALALVNSIQQIGRRLETVVAGELAERCSCGQAVH